MRFLEILVEGSSDMPTVRSILSRRFHLAENTHYRIHPHRGKGTLPRDLTKEPERQRQGLLDQLPAKLRGYGRWATDDHLILVLVDADDDDCVALKRELIAMYEQLPARPPRVLFRIAVEEVESWFLADSHAIKAAYPRAKLSKIARLAPDAVVGAWERLAEALGRKSIGCGGAEKHEWAEAIAPHLDLDRPRSPSLSAFLEGIEKALT